MSGAGWRRPSVVALLLANLVPVAGVFLFGWEVSSVAFLFWAEAVIIGVFNILKMICATPRNIARWIFKIILVPGFCVHYGAFCYALSFFVVGLFMQAHGETRHGGDDRPTLETYRHIIQTGNLLWPVIGLAASHGISFVTNYLRQGEYKSADIFKLMFHPYLRLGLLLAAMVAGCFALAVWHMPRFMVLLLVAVKIVLDLLAHFAERRKFAPRPATTSNG
jgi:hypothetical protein